MKKSTKQMRRVKDRRSLRAKTTKMKVGASVGFKPFALEKHLAIAFTIFIAVAVTFLMVYRVSQIKLLQRDVASLYKELELTKWEQNNLTAQAAALRSPKRIIRIALEECGLVKPTGEHYVYIRSLE